MQSSGSTGWLGHAVCNLFNGLGTSCGARPQARALTWPDKIVLNVSESPYHQSSSWPTYHPSSLIINHHHSSTLINTHQHLSECTIKHCSSSIHVKLELCVRWLNHHIINRYLDQHATHRHLSSLIITHRRALC